MSVMGEPCDEMQKLIITKAPAVYEELDFSFASAENISYKPHVECVKVYLEKAFVFLSM